MHEWYRTFAILAEEKSFTQTAKRLFCSQPTVTQHIQQLESELKCQLIVRNKRQIQLTAQGEIVLLYIHKMQNLEQVMQQELQQTTQKNIPLYISQYIAGHFFAEMFAQQPLCQSAIQYDVMSYCYKELKQFLKDHTAKFAIMPLYDDDKELMANYTVEVLFEEELIFTMSKDHPLASRQVIYARDLKNETILLPNSHYLKELVIGALTEKNVDANFIQMTNFEIIKKAVQQQYGCSFLPKRAVINDSTMVYKPVKGIVIKRKNGIVYNPQLALSDKERLFCERVTQRLMNSSDMTNVSAVVNE